LVFRDNVFCRYKPFSDFGGLVADIYEEARVNALKELARYNNSATVEAALSFNLHNSSQPTNYELWRKGSDVFADDNMGSLKEWVCP
jgi:hypothetical protein